MSEVATLEPEVQATQLTPPEPDPTPAPSTEAEPLAPVVEEPDPDLVSYLAEKGLEVTPAGQEPKGPSTEPKPVDAEVEKRAQELATQTLSKQQRQAEERGVSQAFSTRAQAIRAFTAPWTTGEKLPTPQDIETLVATFNEHHAQSSRISAMNFLDGAYATAEEFFPGIIKERENHASLKDFFTDIQNRATSNGYVSEKEAKKREATALVDRNKYLEGHPEVLRAMLSKASAPKPSGGSMGLTAGAMSLADIDAMPTAQWLALPSEQRTKILADAHAKAGR